jgi:hypothetical protein
MNKHSFWFSYFPKKEEKEKNDEKKKRKNWKLIWKKN